MGLSRENATAGVTHHPFPSRSLVVFGMFHSTGATAEEASWAMLLSPAPPSPQIQPQLGHQSQGVKTFLGNSIGAIEFSGGY